MTGETIVLCENCFFLLLLLRPYQYDFMLLGPYRPTKIKIAFNNDTLDKAHLISALLARPESTMMISYCGKFQIAFTTSQ